MKCKIVKMYPDVKLPKYATDGSGCFDIYAYHGGWVDAHYPTDVFQTGIKVEVPEGHVLLIFSRSGQGFKDDVRLANCVGVIDSDYRGEIKVKLTLDGDAASRFSVHEGQAIAQGMIVPIPKVEWEVVEESQLSLTERGSGGFGSTGTK